MPREETPAGRLVLAATPIGDPRQASPALVELLATADLLAAEDTRRLRRLLSELDVRPVGKVVSNHEHNEKSRATELVAAARDGAVVAVVTDAGMPSVSDPGLRAVREAADQGVRVTVVPGPSAVLTALALSGLATDRFCFEGFPPRKGGERRRALAALADEPRTMVFFEAPHRTADTLGDMAAALGADRPAALCRELTKTHEEVLRAPLGELARRVAEDGVLGEVCLVVAGRPARKGAPGEEDVTAMLEDVDALVAGGTRLKDAVAEVAARTGTAKRALYEAAVHRPR